MVHRGIIIAGLVEHFDGREIEEKDQMALDARTMIFCC
jgi:hypothetical protein